MGKYSEALVAFDVAKKKHAMRSRKGAGREKSGFLGTLRTARRRSSERSRDWRADTIGCMFVLKPGHGKPIKIYSALQYPSHHLQKTLNVRLISPASSTKLKLCR
ncbi:MAG TPA: hypothetical protein VN044_05165 [Verrucomicrobiae bacterium]|nr:hypothetical protein [Verrucomicrobiae bacterium]